MGCVLGKKKNTFVAKATEVSEVVKQDPIIEPCDVLAVEDVKTSVEIVDTIDKVLEKTEQNTVEVVDEDPFGLDSVKTLFSSNAIRERTKINRKQVGPRILKRIMEEIDCASNRGNFRDRFFFRGESEEIIVKDQKFRKSIEEKLDEGYHLDWMTYGRPPYYVDISWK